MTRLSITSESDLVRWFDWHDSVNIRFDVVDLESTQCVEVRAMYGNHPEPNEVALVAPWLSAHARYMAKGGRL